MNRFFRGVAFAVAGMVTLGIAAAQAADGWGIEGEKVVR